MIVLEILFLAVCYLVGRHVASIPEGWFPLLLGLAAFRGGRAVAFNDIFKWLRDLVGIRVVADSSGAGDSTELPDNENVFARLIICPICAGTWFGLALMALYALVPGMGTVLIYVLAAAGIGEILHCLSEYLGWGSRKFREQAGTEWLRKNS